MLCISSWLFLQVSGWMIFTLSFFIGAYVACLWCSLSPIQFFWLGEICFRWYNSFVTTLVVFLCRWLGFTCITCLFYRNKNISFLLIVRLCSLKVYIFFGMVSYILGYRVKLGMLEGVAAFFFLLRYLPFSIHMFILCLLNFRLSTCLHTLFPKSQLLYLWKVSELIMCMQYFLATLSVYFVASWWSIS